MTGGPDTSLHAPDLGLGRVAPRALTAHGITTLGEAWAQEDAALLAVHGVGPKAVRVLRELERRHRRAT